MDTDYVQRPIQDRLAEVKTGGEQRVEGLKVGTPLVVIAAGDATVNTEPRLQGCALKRVPVVGGHRPGENIAVTESARLTDEFRIKVPRTSYAPKASTQGLSRFSSELVCVLR